MPITVRELKQWIQDSGLVDDTVLVMDGDGETVVAAVPDRVAVAYLLIGQEPCEDDDDPELIDGIPGGAGELVFWKNHKSPAPWWIAEWQPDNGRVFAIVNAAGAVGTAGADELSRDFRDAGMGGG